MSDVFAFAPSFLWGVRVRKGERNLIFLRQTDIDAKIVKKHQLKIKEAYEFLFSGSGAHQLSGKELSSRFPKRLKRNLQYAEATKTFCDIMKLQGAAERLKQLNRLVGNPLLKESALAEIERIKNPKAYEQRYKSWRTENGGSKQE